MQGSSRRIAPNSGWEVAFDRRGISGLRSGNLYLYRSGSKLETASAPVDESRQSLQAPARQAADGEDRNADTRQTGTVPAGSL